MAEIAENLFKRLAIFFFSTEKANKQINTILYVILWEFGRIPGVSGKFSTLNNI